MYLVGEKTILAVGTKLQAIITQMAVEIQERHAVVQGIPLVQVSDKHFWFGWPKLILYLIHLTLFQVIQLSSTIYRYIYIDIYLTGFLFLYLKPVSECIRDNLFYLDYGMGQFSSFHVLFVH